MTVEIARHDLNLADRLFAALPTGLLRQSFS